MNMTTKVLKPRRKKYRKKQPTQTVKSHYVDYIDKRTMEIIKFTLSKSIDQFAVNAHDCTFVGEVLATRTTVTARDVFVRWHPRLIFPDEWIPEAQFSRVKLVPLQHLRPKINLIYPGIFPPEQTTKASRKQKRSQPVEAAHHVESSTPNVSINPQKSSENPSNHWALEFLLEERGISVE